MTNKQMTQNKSFLGGRITLITHAIGVKTVNIRKIRIEQGYLITH